VKYIDEFRQENVAKYLSEAIHERAGDQNMIFMEVCGTHTMSIARYGLRELLPENIILISGPGCPVCVTPNSIVDRAIAISRESNVIVTTFGDMLKVPGSSSSLDKEHSRGGEIRIVTSTLEALEIAKHNKEKKVVFLGVGFETTAPTIAVSISESKRLNLNNFFVLAANKVIPPALDALSSGDVKINGYLCPGHVSTIIGTQLYGKLVENYNIGCVVSGFEPVDILQSILMLVDQVRSDEFKVEVQYSRVVKPEGNIDALKILDDVFEKCDSEWRGIGVIPNSGLKIREAFLKWDAEQHVPVKVEPTREAKGCLCGQILQGKIKPPECNHFGKTCTPDNPVGPCMVSSEGTCAAYYKYHVN
jgi:hydrogenase expression/formation protein HypD